MVMKYSKIVKSSDGERVFGEGFLSLSIPALSKTPSGVYVLPTFRTDDDEKLCNWFFKDGKPLPLYKLLDNNEEEVWEQENVSEERYKEKSLYIVVPKGNDETLLFKMEAWGHFAKHIHLSLKKGDEVIFVAKKKTQKNPTNSRMEDVWVLEFIKKQEKPEISSETIVSQLEEEGFKLIDDDDVPF